MLALQPRSVSVGGLLRELDVLLGGDDRIHSVKMRIVVDRPQVAVHVRSGMRDDGAREGVHLGRLRQVLERGLSRVELVQLEDPTLQGYFGVDALVAVWKVVIIH